MRNRQIVVLTRIEAVYPALSDWAVQTFMDCRKSQDLQCEMYSIIVGSINKHTEEDTLNIIRENFQQENERTKLVKFFSFLPK